MSCTPSCAAKGLQRARLSVGSVPADRTLDVYRKVAGATARHLPSSPRPRRRKRAVNLLIVTPAVASRHARARRFRNYNSIRGLAQRHTVDMLTFLAPGEYLAPDSPRRLRRVAASPALPSQCGQSRIASAPTLSTTTPDMGLRLESPLMTHSLAVGCSKPATTWCRFQGISTGAVWAGRCRKATQRAAAGALLFDNHNCEYLLQKRNALTDLRRPRRSPRPPTA